MRNIIPKYTEPNKGNIQTDIVDKTNNNTSQLYDRSKSHGSKMQKFLMKLRSDEPRYKIIRISMTGDSILGFWNAYSSNFKTYLETLYPNKTFEFLYNKLGGTGAPYFMSGTNEIINFNPDLALIMEWEGLPEMDYLETIFKIIRKRTSSDICVIPWTIAGSDMDLLSSQNIEGFKASTAQQVRNIFMSFCAKYNAQFIDTHQPWFKVLLDGTETSETLLQDGLHPNENGFSYWSEEFNKHFSPSWDYEQLIYNGDGKYFNTVFFREVNEIPDLTELVKSGAWDVNVVNTDNTLACLRTSEVGAYVEFEFDGIGFELSHFGDSIGEFKIEIALSGGVLANPSDLLKDYFTDMGGGEAKKFYHLIVDSNILANNEDSITVYWEITAITRDGTDNITSCIYKLTDVTNGGTIIASELEALQDETVAYRGGQITLPKMYASVQNLRDDSGTMLVGFYTSTNLQKNWYNSISQIADNTTTVTRMFGFPKGKHLCRITNVSGTVNLDSVMELK